MLKKKHENTVCAIYMVHLTTSTYACRQHKNGLQAARNDLMVRCATFVNLMVLF